MNDVPDIRITPSGIVEPEVRRIPLDLVDDWQLNPRKRPTPEDDAKLTLSIAQKGVLMAILVRPQGDGRFETIAGNRRRRCAVAARDAGAMDDDGVVWKLPADYQMPCQVRECDDAEALRLAFRENMERVDMHPLDERDYLAALLPTVTPRPKETAAAAIARLFPTIISERTTYRRLSLRGLAPEAETALDQGEITIAQAEALAVGSHDDQRTHLRSMAQHSMFQSDPASIKRVMLRERVPFSRAIFDLALYTGEIVTDPDTGDQFFADAAEFAALQATAVEQKKTELATDWLWVEVMHNPGSDAYHTNGIKKNDQDAGAVIVVRRDNSVEIVAPAILKATLDKRQAQARRDAGGASNSASAGGKGKAAAPEPQRLMTPEQVRSLHHDKTRALRAGIADSPRVALALDVLALLGCTDEVMIDGDTSCRYEHKTGPIAMPMVTGMHIEDLLKKAAAAMPAAHRPNDKAIRAMLVGEHGSSSDDESEHDYPARWFRALLSLDDGDLRELHALLVAARCASWIGDDDEFHYGDSPLAVAIAEAVDGGRRLAEDWSPGREWFLGYSHKRLIEIARVHLRIQKPERLKKDALIDACLEQPRGFWTPALLPEAAFQLEADAVKALTAPLPAGELAKLRTDDECILEASQVLAAYHDAVTEHGGVHSSVATAADRIDAIAIEMHGGDNKGMAVDNGGQVRLARALTAEPGMMPLWGQPGEFVMHMADGDRLIPLRITVEGLFGISDFGFYVHAADPDLPFISATGYQSFLGSRLPEPGQSLTAFCLAEIERSLTTNDKGKLLKTRKKLIALDERVRDKMRAELVNETASTDMRASRSAEAHVLGVLRDRAGAPIDDLAVDSGFTRDEINDAVMRLLASGDVLPSDDGYRLPAEPPIPARGAQGL